MVTGAAVVVAALLVGAVVVAALVEAAIGAAMQEDGPAPEGLAEEPAEAGEQG